MRPARITYISLILWLLALSGPAKLEASGRPVEILIAAAASLAPYCQAMGRRFEALTPGVRVRFTFASSGHLRQQIEAGAPVDGFISASILQMDLLERNGLIRPETRLPLAQNSLALIVSSREVSPIRTFSDLASDKVKSIALGDPSHVPAGSYGRAALESLNLWEVVKPKLIYGLDVRQVLEYVRQGEVDAGLVYLSDAHLEARSIRVAAIAPKGSHPRIIYPMVVLKDAAHSKQTKTFFAFLSSSEGQKALRDFNLQPLPSKPLRSQGAVQ